VVTLHHHPDWYMQPVMRDGRFYLAFANQEDSAPKRNAVDVFRVPVTVTSTSPLKIDVDKGRWHRITNTDSTLERPGVEAETNDAVIVWYTRIGLNGSNPKPETRYNVHYASDGEFDFREGVTLHTGAGAVSGDLQKWADIDLPGGNSDPGAVAFWISHIYTNSSSETRQVVAQIKPGCGAKDLCGTECTDFDTDHDNCGSCGHACASKQECEQGKCKDLPCGGANLMTDPKNCGTCGHVCPVGECTAGHCCEQCVCSDGFKAGTCMTASGCEHICRGHERRRRRPGGP
jgi:hypothetical protein